MKPFKVRTRLLAEVAKWSYQHDDRPHLARVLFDGKHMIATDGHRMVVVTCETGCEPFTLDREDCALLAAAQREITKARGATLEFTSVADRKAVVALDVVRTATVRAREVGDYPPWETLFKGLEPKTPTPPEYAFNPHFLAGIAPVIESVDPHSTTVKIKAWTAIEDGGFCGPMLFESTAYDDQDAFEMRFLIMAKRI